MLTGELSTPVNLEGEIYRGVGSTDYNELENKPTYNGHIIEGNLTSEILGIWQPKNFSTDEQKTGLKWIDGKDLYTKVITTPNVSGDGNINISSLNTETAFIFGGFIHLTGGANISLNEYLGTVNYSYCHVNGNQIDYNLRGYTGIYNIIILYTKSTD